MNGKVSILLICGGILIAFIVFIVRRIKNTSNLSGFIEALEHNDTEKAKFFLQKVKNVNLSTKKGWSLLFSAIYCANSEIVSILLQRGADLNKVYGDLRETPLHMAVKCGHLDIIKILIDIGRVDPNIREFGNVPPLSCVPHPYKNNNKKNGTDIIKLLVSKGADVNAVDDGGSTPLIHAMVEAADIEFQFIKDLSSGAGNMDFRSFLDKQEYALEEVKAFITAGADINVHGPKGMTPLIIACMAGFYDIAKLLCEKGAKIDDIDNCGKTALIGACMRKRTKIVSLLLEKGCNKNIKDNEGKTAIEIAREKNYEDIVKLLEE